MAIEISFAIEILRVFLHSVSNISHSVISHLIADHVTAMDISLFHHSNLTVIKILFFLADQSLLLLEIIFHIIEIFHTVISSQSLHDPRHIKLFIDTIRMHSIWTSKILILVLEVSFLHFTDKFSDVHVFLIIVDLHVFLDLHYILIHVSFLIDLVVFF